MPVTTTPTDWPADADRTGTAVLQRRRDTLEHWLRIRNHAHTEGAEYHRDR